MTNWPLIGLLRTRLAWWRGKRNYRSAEVEHYKIEGDRAHYWLDKHKKNGEAKAAALNEAQILAIRPFIAKWQKLLAEAATEIRALETAIAKLVPKPPANPLIDPFHKIVGLTPMGLDKGVDFGGTGEIVAMGNCVVNYASAHTTWPGGAFIGLTFTDGPYKGKHTYHAENLTILVHEGQHVARGQAVAVLHNAYPYSESGWGAGYGENTLAAQLGQPRNSECGASYNRLLKKLGCVSGGDDSAAVGTMPPGYP